MVNDQIIKMIRELVEDKYIKEGWFDDIINLFNNTNENKNNLSIIDCIEKCTSPKVSENKAITNDDLELIFKAFSLFKPEETRVLILGQDPYPSKGKNKGRADGLAFSQNGITPAYDSLLNIFKAIKVYQYKEEVKLTKYFCDINENEVSWGTNLECWAKNNGILLLNTALTFDEKTSLTKRKNVWEPFVQKIITKLLTYNNSNLVIFLWGKEAQNTFLRVLNNMEYKANIEKQLKPPKKNKAIVYKNNQKKLKINDELIRAVVNINIKNCEYKLFMTSHPSNNRRAVYKGFSEDVPNHFEACDGFLEDENGNKLNIWKNFPENNNEDYYKNKK